MPDKFVCCACEFAVNHDYFGNKPPFCKSLTLMEEAYVMKDPFSDKTGAHQPLILGSHCSLCQKCVCVGQDCSLFYSKRFCMECVQGRIEDFPREIQQEIAKRKTKQESG